MALWSTKEKEFLAKLQAKTSLRRGRGEDSVSERSRLVVFFVRQSLGVRHLSSPFAGTGSIYNGNKTTDSFIVITINKKALEIDMEM